MTTPWTQRQMIEVASRAVGRVLAEDLRGITKLSVDEIAAMALTLAVFGLIPTPPGQDCPANLIFTPKKEADDGI
jgi:hypothetical protein